KAGLFKALAERGDQACPFGRQARNPITGILLLRVRRERPRGRRAAEQRDELAPFHCPMPPVLPTERIAHPQYGRRMLPCGISIWSMSPSGCRRNHHLGWMAIHSVIAHAFLIPANKRTDIAIAIQPRDMEEERVSNTKEAAAKTK